MIKKITKMSVETAYWWMWKEKITINWLEWKNLTLELATSMHKFNDTCILRPWNLKNKDYSKPLEYLFSRNHETKIERKFYF